MINLKSQQLEGLDKEDIRKILTAEALLKSRSYLSLLRYRCEQDISWDSVDAPSLLEMDQLLGRLDYLLNYKED